MVDNGKILNFMPLVEGTQKIAQSNYEALKRQNPSTVSAFMKACSVLDHIKKLANSSQLTSKRSTALNTEIVEYILNEEQEISHAFRMVEERLDSLLRQESKEINLYFESIESYIYLKKIAYDCKRIQPEELKEDFISKNEVLNKCFSMARDKFNAQKRQTKKGENPQEAVDMFLEGTQAYISMKKELYDLGVIPKEDLLSYVKDIQEDVMYALETSEEYYVAQGRRNYKCVNQFMKALNAYVAIEEVLCENDKEAKETAYNFLSSRMNRLHDALDLVGENFDALDRDDNFEEPMKNFLEGVESYLAVKDFMTSIENTPELNIEKSEKEVDLDELMKKSPTLEDIENRVYEKSGFTNDPFNPYKVDDSVIQERLKNVFTLLADKGFKPASEVLKLTDEFSNNAENEEAPRPLENLSPAA